MGEPEELIPGRRERQRIVVTDEYLLSLLDVPHGQDGHDPPKPGVLKLFKCGVPQLEVMAGLVTQGGAVLVAGLVLGPDIKIYRLVQSQSAITGISLSLSHISGKTQKEAK